MIKRDENYYDLICATDPVNPVMDLLKAERFNLDDEFKIVVEGKKKIDREWLNAAHDEERCCGLWHGVYFKCYKIIPRGCRNCWKCCIKLSSLEDLFKIRDFQLENQDQPAKCGLEKRGYTANLGRYSAYWYCDLTKGLKGARALWSVLNEKLTTVLGTDNHGLILKRGCTELELHTIEAGIGNSDKWDALSEGWDRYEDILDHIYVLKASEKSELVPWWIEKNIERRWIEWAYEYGDPTYIKYTGSPLTRPLEMYHGDSVHSSRDFRSTWDTPGDGVDRDRIIPLNGTIEGDNDGTDNSKCGYKDGEGSGTDNSGSGGSILPLV